MFRVLILLLAPPLAAQDAAALSQKAAEAMRAKRFTEAESAYRQLVALDPDNPMWHMNLGLAIQSAGRHKDAVPEFEAFLKARPQPGPIHLLLGMSRLKLGKPCDAIPTLEKARAWNPARSLVELADAYYGCRRYEDAARTYEAALATPLKSQAIVRQAGHCFWQARLYDDARRLFRTLVSALAADPDFQYEFGDTLARIEGPESGLPYLQRATEARPNWLPPRGELGKALLATGKPQDAIAHLQAAAREDPTFLLPLSQAYKATGQSDLASKALTDYRRLVPNQ